MLIKWKAEFCIDNGPIDADHLNIIGRINHIMKIVKPAGDVEDVLWALRELYTVAHAHFFREEALQETAGFPGIAEHRREHERLLASLWAQMAEIEAMALRPADPQMARRLVQCKAFLYRWILGHILDQDRKMAGYVEAMQAADYPLLSPHIEDVIFRMDRIAPADEGALRAS